jgi:copper chaperone CopZ
MKYLLIVLISAFSFAANAQESSKKIAESTFEVDGVCGMCKKRIENAALRTPGVKLAEWNVETHQLKLVYKTSKVSEEELHKAVIAAGHDTEKMKAEDSVYEQIHGCCHYRDEAVIKQHDKNSGSGSSQD